MLKLAGCAVSAGRTEMAMLPCLRWIHSCSVQTLRRRAQVSKRVSLHYPHLQDELQGWKVEDKKARARSSQPLLANERALQPLPRPSSVMDG